MRDGPGWVVVNVATGGYLSVTENLVDGVQVVVSSDPTQWDITNDDEDPSVYRYAYPPRSAYLRMRCC